MVNLQETESGRPVELFPSPHPLTPPQCAEDRHAWLRLLRSRRVGVTTFFRLLAEHGSAQAALDALPAVARAAGVSGYQLCPPGVVDAELKAGRLCGARLIAFGTPEYPASLADIGAPPPLIWALGDLNVLQRPMVALVGARNASSLGTRMARKLGGDLADAGFCVVSGLARGVDAAAHMAALDGATVAVMAGGVDVIYPVENTVLAQEIAEKGLRLSEQPMGMTPQARHFPRRNRIISGLARTVVVIEAAAKSGSLITARNALDQGRDVLAVPGHPFDARAAGCNMLIRDGAQLVRGVQDVLEAAGPAAAEPQLQPQQQPREPLASDTPDIPPPPPQTRSKAQTRALHEQILSRLGPSPLGEDQLIRDLALPAEKVTSELVNLELDGRIRRKAGGLLALEN